MLVMSVMSLLCRFILFSSITSLTHSLINTWSDWFGTATSWTIEDTVQATDLTQYITSVCVKNSTEVHEIEVTFSNGDKSGPYGGGSIGNLPWLCFSVQSDECFVSINLRIGARMDQMQWLTSSGRTSPAWGGNGGNPLIISSTSNNVCISQLILRVNYDRDPNAICQIKAYFLGTSTTQNPTKDPTNHPSKAPTKAPTKTPTKTPTKYPTKYPTQYPTLNPTKSTFHPSIAPTIKPSDAPSFNEAAVVDKTTETNDIAPDSSNDDASNASDQDSVLVQVPLVWLWITISAIAVVTICVLSVCICSALYLKRKRENEIKEDITNISITNMRERVESASNVGIETNEPGANNTNDANAGEDAMNTMSYNMVNNMMRPQIPVPLPPSRVVEAASNHVIQAEQVLVTPEKEGEGISNEKDNNALLYNTPQGLDEDNDIVNNDDNNINDNDNDSNSDIDNDNNDEDNDSNSDIDNNDEELEEDINEIHNDDENDGAYGQCADCGETRVGRMYDTDDLFYCNECWLNYE